MDRSNHFDREYTLLDKVPLSQTADEHACRGLVACANQNAPHTNNSQFFISMDRCDHLDRKNTIFGKVTGESIYNAMHLNEQEVSLSSFCSSAVVA